MVQAIDAFKRSLAALANQHADALGYVVAVNGKVTGADVYASHDLFRKLWPEAARVRRGGSYGRPQAAPETGAS